MPASTRTALFALTGFREGKLPVAYFGVPLVTACLKVADCNRLVEITASRITHWTARFLSYAGRLQLVNSVLFAIQTYWSSIFILPTGVLVKLERMFSNFLWSGSSSKPSWFKTSWEEVTRPRKEDLELKNWQNGTKLLRSNISGSSSQELKGIFGLNG